MKTIIFIFYLFCTVLYANTQPEYIKDISQNNSDSTEYSVKVSYSQSFTDDGTVGFNFIKLIHSLEFIKQEHPNATNVNLYLVNENNEKIDGLEINTNVKNLNLENRENTDLTKELLDNGSILADQDILLKLNEFIKKGSIPKI